MPIFEYHCKVCGARFEELISRADLDKAQTCPECGAADTEKLSSTFATSTATRSGGGAPRSSGGCSSGGG